MINTEALDEVVRRLLEEFSCKRQARNIMFSRGKQFEQWCAYVIKDYRGAMGIISLMNGPPEETDD